MHMPLRASMSEAPHALSVLSSTTVQIHPLTLILVHLNYMFYTSATCQDNKHLNYKTQSPFLVHI